MALPDAAMAQLRCEEGRRMIRDDEAGTTLKTVERALRMLEIIAAHPGPVQVRQVAVELGHNVSSTYHLVNTLIAGGYLVKDGSGSLRLGPKIGMLSAALARGDDYASLLRPLIEQLAAACGETVYLSRWQRDRVVIQAVVESAQSLRVTGLTVGYSGSEDRRASGKAVLAFVPETTVDAVLQRAMPDATEAERAFRAARLRAELAMVRQYGFAFDNEDYEPGVCCVAVPYFDGAGEVAGSVAVSAPAARIDTLRHTICDQVRATAAQMSRLLHAPQAVEGPAS